MFDEVRGITERARLQCLSAECLGGTPPKIPDYQTEPLGLQCLSAECLGGTTAEVVEIHTDKSVSPMPFG